jgi:uncharacterized membrane protein
VGKDYLKDFLSDHDLQRISHKISEIEKNTSGEIRLCIKINRGFLERKFTPRELAMNEFFSLKMDKTRDKTGVLIFILFKERKFEIVADEGINSKIPAERWNDITASIVHEFKNENYLQGILNAVARIGEVLTREFPPSPDDKDELENEVIIN